MVAQKIQIDDACTYLNT